MMTATVIKIMMEIMVTTMMVNLNICRPVTGQQWVCLTGTKLSNQVPIEMLFMVVVIIIVIIIIIIIMMSNQTHNRATFIQKIQQ